MQTENARQLIGLWDRIDGFGDLYPDAEPNPPGPNPGGEGRDVGEDDPEFTVAPGELSEDEDADGIPDNLDPDIDLDELELDLDGGLEEQDASEDVDELSDIDLTDAQDLLDEDYEIDVGGSESSDLWDDSIEDRDRRIREYDREPDHQEVREYVRRHDIVDDLRDRLSEMGVRERQVTTDDGDLLDMRNVVRRLSGDVQMDEYWRQRAEIPGERIAVGASIDMSGSMSSDELEAKAAAGAFLFAVEQTGGEVVANGWDSSMSETRARIVTNPYEPFEWRHLDAIWPDGGTPTARGMWECAQMLHETRPDEKMLIVITDGQPTDVSRTDVDADGPADEVEKTVEDLRNSGLAVFGIGIGYVSERKMDRMFGEDQSEKVEIEELPDALMDCYEEHYGSAKREVLV